MSLHTIILFTLSTQPFTNLPPSQMKFSDIGQLDSDRQNSIRLSLVRAVLHEVDGVVAHQHLAGDLLARQNKRTLLHVPDSITRTQLGNDNTWNKIFKFATLKHFLYDLKPYFKKKLKETKELPKMNNVQRQNAD